MAVSIDINYIDFDIFSFLCMGTMGFMAVNGRVIDFNYLFCLTGL